MIPTYRDQGAAITVIAGEATSGTPAERRMVAWTFFNRMAVNPKRYGSTVAAVCYKRMQYSEMNDDPVDNADLERVSELPEDDAVLQDCAAAYSEVLAAVAVGAEDPTGGATHYYGNVITPPKWAAQGRVTVVTPNFTFLTDVP